MKKRFLPFSLLLVIMILGQAVMADGGHYVPRAKETTSVEAFMSSMRVNQHTGLIDPAWMIAASKQTVTNTKSELPDDLYWISMGPDNLGGRTTSIIYNNQNQSEVYIGSMGGGVFRTTQGVSWSKIGQDLLVSCMAQAEDGTIYVGTGDGSNASDNNGLVDLGYENSFIGTGIYTIKGTTMSEEPMEGTAPSTLNGVSEWSFVNDLAVVGNNLVAATSDGLRYCALDGGEWSYAKCNSANIEGNAVKVKVANDNKIVASVDGVLYIGTLDDMKRCSGQSAEVTDDNGHIVEIAPAASTGLLDITVAPSDKKVVYASLINNKGNHDKIYVSFNLGDTWQVALPAVTVNQGHNVYGTKGLYNYNMVVDPNNTGCVYILAKDIWRLEKPAQEGYYIAVPMSSESQVHGMNDLQFDPKGNGKTGYVATDGGIYKFDSSIPEYFQFNDANKNYISTRCLNVTPTNEAKRILGGVLDHAPFLIAGQENTNTLGTAAMLLPSYTPVSAAVYSEDYISGSSAVSVINPDVFFVTSMENTDIRIKRTEHAGADWDESNFTGQEDLLGEKIAFAGLRMPFALYETFEDENSIETVWFKCTKDQKAGDVVKCYSHNAGYPFDYTLPVDMHYDTASPSHSDSLLVPDPVTAKLYVPNEVSSGTQILMTFDGLQFGKITEWYNIATFSGTATCFEVSADGDVLFIGTKEGKLVRVSNLNAVVDSLTAYTEVDTTVLNLGDQCITSVAVFNEDNNKVVVTLGNYGNECNILYSDDAMEDAPVFVSKQGTGLPLMPIYSSVYTVYRHTDASGNIDEEGEHVVIGTEHGIYRTADITAASPVWVADQSQMGDVPVLDLRQQNVPGMSNQGMIYAATYGRGLFRCENYHVQYSGESVPETPAVVAESKVTMYPNPVRDAARVSFELNGNANVSYQVYDFNGRMVKAEQMGSFGQGKHEINVSVDGLATGAYVLRLNAGSQTSNVKFMVF